MQMGLVGNAPSLSIPRRRRAGRDLTDNGLREVVYRLLCLFWFTLPGEGVIRLGGEATISKGVGVLLAVVALISVFKSGVRFRANDYIVLILVYGGWVALSLFWTFTVPETEKRILTMAQLVISVLITWEFAHSERRIRGLMTAWVAGCFAIALIIVFAFVFGASQARYTAPGTHPGDQAYALLIAIPMAWYLATRTSHKALSVAYRLFVPFALLATILTASRAALLSAVLALLIIPVMWRQSSSRTRAGVWVGVVVSVVAGLFLITAGSGPIARLSTTSSEISSGTLDNRTTIWSIALRLIGEHPVLGIGAGGSNTAVGGSFVMDKSVHNTLLNIAVELGVIGIGLFFLILLAAGYRAVTKLPRREMLFARVLLIIFVAALIPRPDDYGKSTFAILTLLALMGAVMGRSSKPAADRARAPHFDEPAGLTVPRV